MEALGKALEPPVVEPPVEALGKALEPPVGELEPPVEALEPPGSLDASGTARGSTTDPGG